MFSRSNGHEATKQVTREKLHTRHLEMEGFSRSDGLFEVVGRLTDQKPSTFSPASSGHSIPAHEPIHDMGVRLVFDHQMVVREVETFTNAAPYEACPDGGHALQAINGLRISAGWSREVRRRLSGPSSCTHLKELLIPLATTAIQSMSAIRANQPEAVGENGRPRQIDSCYAYAADGDLVARRWPEFHRSKPYED